MKSYRERYFEDYVAVADEKRPGKVKYIYSGPFLRCYVENKSLKGRKLEIAALELLNIVVYAAAAVQKVPFNTINIVAGFGMLALIPWILEIAAVVRFCAFPEYIPEASKNGTDKMMSYGVQLHMALLVVLAAAGSISLIQSGSMTFPSVLVMLGHLCCCGLSFWAYRLYRGVYAETYHNDHGKVGKSY